MKILRSILPEPRVGDDPDLMARNFALLRESILGFDLPEDVRIYDFLKEFFSSHGHLPTQDTAIAYFEANNYLDEADRIRQIAPQAPIYRGDFAAEIEKQVEEARVIQITTAMSDAKSIVRQGMEIKEGRKKRTLRGTRDAGRYLNNKLADIMTPTFGSRIGGEALSDEEDFWEEYDKAKNGSVDILPKTGLQPIDDVFGGFKKKELYILAGYTGHMKSRTALNWVYTQSIFQGISVLYFSLEMHYSQCRRTIVAFHTMHPKFRAQRIALGIQKPNAPDVGIDPTKIRQGGLSEEEEHFLKDVVKDLADGRKNGTYGGIRFEVADPDSLDFTVEDLRTRAELIIQSEPFKLLVVDHALLMSSRFRHSSTTDKLNEVIRDLKKTALGFNRGAGIPILCLFQISREGFKSAEKSNGKYNLTHLSYANEAERSADAVIAGWFGDDMRSQGMISYQCLKSRDQAPFESFEAQVVWPTGRILNMPLRVQHKGTTTMGADPLDSVLDG